MVIFFGSGGRFFFVRYEGICFILESKHDGAQNRVVCCIALYYSLHVIDVTDRILRASFTRLSPRSCAYALERCVAVFAISCPAIRLSNLTRHNIRSTFPTAMLSPRLGMTRHHTFSCANTATRHTARPARISFASMENLWLLSVL